MDTLCLSVDRKRPGKASIPHTPLVRRRPFESLLSLPIHVKGLLHTLLRPHPAAHSQQRAIACLQLTPSGAGHTRRSPATAPFLIRRNPSSRPGAFSATGRALYSRKAWGALIHVFLSCQFRQHTTSNVGAAAQRLGRTDVCWVAPIPHLFLTRMPPGDRIVTFPARNTPGFFFLVAEAITGGPSRGSVEQAVDLSLPTVTVTA